MALLTVALLTMALFTLALLPMVGLAALTSAARAAPVAADLARGAGPALATRYTSLLLLSLLAYSPHSTCSLALLALLLSPHAFSLYLLY